MQKTNRKAVLVRYARLPDLGWRRGSIVTGKTNKVKPDVMRLNGQNFPIPADSLYQVRFYVRDKVKYTTVGRDYDAASVTLSKYLASRQLESAQDTLGIVKPTAAVEPPKPLTQLVIEYIEKKKSPSLDLSSTTIRHYQDTLPEFARSCDKEYVHEITEEDVTKYMDRLVKQDYSQKTRSMRYTTIRGFLRASNVDLVKLIDGSTHKRLGTRPPGNTNPFTPQQLDLIYDKCDEYHRLVFQFLVATGLRFREANHLTWSNIDFERNVITVPFKQRVNRLYHNRRTRRSEVKAVEFQTKSRRNREVPIFASLRPLLLAWRKKHPTRVYVFGSIRSDMPDNHWLSYGKRAWEKAGLNCDTCDACVKTGECKEFFLHKFRHSFAHFCLDAGIPIHKVSRWMGHHSIEVTALYLSGGSLESDKDPFGAMGGVAAD